jgi:Methylase involved in ubiquinone/menaquinone biosynthesis
MLNATDPYNKKAFTPEERQIIELLDERALLAVLRLLRFYELGDYYPLFVERDNEYEILNSRAKNELTVELLLWYFKQAESRGALCDGISSGGKQGTVLELGCGWGDDTSFLVKTGYDIISCDRSEDALRNIRKRYPSVTVYDCDLREPLPFGDAIADIVIASLCLHYFADFDMRHVLSDIRRVIKPDGILLCRLNSENCRHRGVAGEVEIEPGICMTKEGLKRFFTEDVIISVFINLTIIHLEEYRTEKFSRNMCLFEVAIKP